MRYIIAIAWVSLLVFAQANILDTIKAKTKNIGKQTPVDIAVYAKNKSSVCSLRITNIRNPYKNNLTQGKLETIVLDTGKYHRSDISHLLKGAYEFEYKWKRDGKFIDSRLRTIHIFAYHDTGSKVHKKVNLTFLLRVPKMCR